MTKAMSAEEPCPFCEQPWPDGSERAAIRHLARAELLEELADEFRRVADVAKEDDATPYRLMVRALAGLLRERAATEREKAQGG